jgi:hypothetical protein
MEFLREPEVPGLPERSRARYPRLNGAGMFAVGMLFAGFTIYARVVSRAVCMAPIFILYGGWFMVVGRPVDSATGKTKDWVEIGGWLSGVLGMIVGAVVLFLL